MLADGVLLHHVKLAADRAKGEQRSRSRSPSPRARSPPRRPQSAKPKQTPRVPTADEAPLTRKQKNNRRRAKLRAAKKELAPYIADGDDDGDSEDPPRQIFIRPLDGGTFVITIGSETPMPDLTYLVARKLGATTNLVQLLYQGRPARS